MFAYLWWCTILILHLKLHTGSYMLLFYMKKQRLCMVPQSNNQKKKKKKKKVISISSLFLSPSLWIFDLMNFLEKVIGRIHLPEKKLSLKSVIRPCVYTYHVPKLISPGSVCNKFCWLMAIALTVVSFLLSFLLSFLWPHLKHVEVPKPGIKSAPQQQPKPLQWHSQILNLLSHKGTPLGQFHSPCYKTQL